MTDEEKKRQSVPKLVSGVITVLCYAVWVFWLVLPLWLTYFAVPVVTGFFAATGLEPTPILLALIKYSGICGIICTSINIGFPLWRFFIKRSMADVFSGKPFFWWVLATNLMLIVWLIMSTFFPVYD